jgi:hypothetical protein
MREEETERKEGKYEERRKKKEECMTRERGEEQRSIDEK